VLSKWLSLIVLLLFSTAWGESQPTPAKAAKPGEAPSKSTERLNNANKALKAIIVAEQAYIFKQPNFDAEVITILTPGKTIYYISRGKWGPFHKIRLSPTQNGYVLDSDVRKIKDPKDKSKNKNDEDRSADEAKDKAKKKPRARSMMGMRGWGPVLQVTDFAESTMGSVFHETMPFYGLKFSGPNTFFEGATYTDADLLIHWGAPGYYSDATTNSASGWIILADVFWEMTQLQSKNVITYFGFGPMFRYSHISSTLQVGAQGVDYSLDDMVLGAAINVGTAARMGKYALRFDGKYYWEKQKYWALGLAFQFEF
jgi:hypothetical protein